MEKNKNSEQVEVQNISTDCARAPLEKFAQPIRKLLKKVLPGMLLIHSGCTVEQHVVHLPVSTQASIQPHQERIQKALDVLQTTPTPTPTPATTVEVESTHSAVPVEIPVEVQQEVVQQAMNLIQPVAQKNEVPIRQVKEPLIEKMQATDFGRFFEEFIEEYPEEEKDGLRKALSLLTYYEHNGMYFPSMNTKLLREGIQVAIDYETILPMVSRDQVRPYVEKALTQLEELTGISMTLADTKEQANCILGVTANKHEEQETSWLGFAYTERTGKLDGQVVPFFGDVYSMRLFLGRDLQTYLNKILSQEAVLGLSPLEQEKIRILLQNTGEEDILLQRAVHTVMHEIIHLLGLDHTDSKNSIMYPYNHVDYLPKVGEEGDILRTQYLSDAMNPEMWQKDPIYPLMRAMHAYSK